MVRRDPQTGKFVSGSSSDGWHEQTRVAGRTSYTIPAADLAGGNTTVKPVGSATELVDFTEVLGNDEVFEVLAAHVSASFFMPTTATSESSGFASFFISADNEVKGAMDATPTFYGGGQNDEYSKADISRASNEAGTIMYHTTLAGEAGHSDSATGLAAGASVANESEWLPFHRDLGGGPVFDRDDELYAPGEISVDNVSDHAVVLSVSVVLYGRVEELD